MKDVIVNEENGLLFTSRSKGSLVDALARARQHCLSESSQLRIKARETIEQDFTQQKEAKRYLRLVERLTN
jgi:glycosyltransferase involved in cell wall biosynthesis